MILRTENLVKKYGQRLVNDHISYQVAQGEIVGLLGPNGAGKTTSFYIATGLVKPNEGKVFLDDLDVTDLPMYKRARLGIGYLAQEASVFRTLSVEENIQAVLEMTDLSKAAQKEKVESLLEEFSLTHVRKSLGQVLSGGERRRTEIARALAVDPKFILLDEPFGALDEVTRATMQKLLLTLRDDLGTAAVLITHDIDEALQVADRILLLGGAPAHCVGEWHLAYAQPREDLVEELGQLRIEILRALQRALHPKPARAPAHSAPKELVDVS